jgi:uncharacterized protein YndB with AHSA1/START domain
MKFNLLFEFTVDKATSTIFVNREFAAGRALVWDAFTKPELLDEWWAPKPWTTKTKYVSFQAGGRRLYAMCSPEGQDTWLIQDFVSITPKINFQFIEAFCDKDENINTSLPIAEWNLDFSEARGITTVKIKVKHKDIAALEQIIAMGFKEGFTFTLNYLEGFIQSRKGKDETKNNK